MGFRPASDALKRFTVLDLTRVRSGPTCVRQLADWGANVIKVEMPASEGEGLGGARDGSDFINLHRNKRSLSLNLKTPQGVAIFKKLAERADVVVENYRPDVKRRLGIDYDTLRKINPRIVYGSISGFGQDGPYAERPGFDQVAQGMGGLMSITGLPGQGPVRVGIPVADLCAGMFCAMGILTALLERDVSGEGQWVQTSLLQAQIFMLDFQSARWLVDGEIPQQAGNNHPTSIPTGVFPTKDGHINIAVAGSEIWKRFCETIGRPDFIEKTAYATSASRSKNRDDLNAEISKVTITRTSLEWVELLNRKGVPSGAIYAIDEVFDDAQVRHLGVAQELDTRVRGLIKLAGQPIALNRTPSHLVTEPPGLGEHTDQILAEFGYSARDIEEFRNTGAV